MSNSELIVSHVYEGFMIENELHQLACNDDDGFSCDIWQSLNSLVSNYDDYPDALAAQKVYRVQVMITEMVKDSDSEGK